MADDSEMAQYSIVNHLRSADGFIIKQKVELLEAATGGLLEGANKYTVFDTSGQPKFLAVEDSNCCCRVCCAPKHEFELHIFETNDGRSVNGGRSATIHHPCKCSFFAIMDFCRDEAIVYDGERQEGAQPIGWVKAPFLGGGTSPHLHIMDRTGENQYNGMDLNGPDCCIGACCDSTFTITKGGEEFGFLRKEGPEGAGDMAKELLTDADNFTMRWNDAVDDYTKVSLLASLFLIDYMFFEDDGNFKCNPCEPSCSLKLCDFFCCGCLVPCKLKYSCAEEEGEGGEEE